MSRLAVAQARVRRVIGTCYAIWKVPPNGYGRSPQSPRRERLVNALARLFARTRAASPGSPVRRLLAHWGGSAQRRHRYRSGPKASGTGCALQLRLRRLWDSNSRRGQRHKVGGKCGSPAVGCRFGFVASAALPVLLRLVAACQTNNCGNSGTAAFAAQSLFSQRLYAFSGVAPKGNPRAARFLGRRFRTPVRCPERLFARCIDKQDNQPAAAHISSSNIPGFGARHAAPNAV